MIDAARLRAIADRLQGPDGMGDGGLEIDDWLAARGVEGLNDFLSEAVATVVIGVATAGGDTPTAITAGVMHGFFVGLEAGTETISAPLAELRQRLYLWRCAGEGEPLTLEAIEQEIARILG